MQRTLSQLQDIQNQISANKRITKASDDPVGAASSLRLRSDVDRSDQIDRNLGDAQAWLNTADDTLGEVVTQVQRARDLAIQSQNGALAQTERDAIATELDKIRETMLGLANTQYSGRSIFAGTANTAAYDSSGNFLGTSNAVERTVSPGVRVRINVTGDDVFGPSGADLFANIATLATAVRGGNTNSIDAAVVAIDTRTSTVQARLAEVGARTRRIETMKDRNDSGAISLKQELSSVEDIDLPKALIEAQLRQVAYQAALQTTAKVIQPTLVDFLR
jgi:flagellar hook-associated protein 3 FlgL